MGIKERGKHEQLINNCEIYRKKPEKEEKVNAIGESETEVTKKISDVDKDNF